MLYLDIIAVTRFRYNRDYPSCIYLSICISRLFLRQRIHRKRGNVNKVNYNNWDWKCSWKGSWNQRLESRSEIRDIGNWHIYLQFRKKLKLTRNQSCRRCKLTIQSTIPGNTFLDYLSYSYAQIINKATEINYHFYTILFCNRSESGHCGVV